MQYSFFDAKATASKQMIKAVPSSDALATQREDIESQENGITIYKTDDEKTKKCKYALIHIRSYYAELKDEIENWVKQKFQEQENFSIIFIAYQQPSRLGESGCITMQTQSEAIFHYGATSYGMGNSASTKEEVKQLLLEIYDEKRRELSIPYSDPNVAWGFGLRSTKPENIKVFFTPRAKEFILNLNINPDKFLHCYESLKGAIATDEDIAETKRLEELEQQIEREKAECEQVKSTVSNFFGVGYHYEKKEVDVSGVDIGKLTERFLELKRHIAEHEEMVNKIRNKYWERKASIERKEGAQR